MTATAGEQAGPVYLDSCVLLSLFLGDSGFDASETWLLSRDGTELWISHWVLLEFAGVVATCVRRGQLTAERARWIESEFECFRQERLHLLEPRGSDFLQECRTGLPGVAAALWAILIPADLPGIRKIGDLVVA